MQTSTSGRKAWLWLAVLLLLFMVISYFTVSKEPKEYPDYVSQSPSPTGVKALYTYLDDENISVKRWKTSPASLPDQNEQQVLIMAEPLFIPEQQEMDSYEAFMEAGNTILLLKSNPEGMFDIKTEPLTEELNDETAVSALNGETYHAAKYSPVRLQEKDGDEVLLSDEADTIAMKRSYGEGELIVTNTPEWITNDMILDEDHLDLLFMLLPEEPGKGYTILFDEYSHGSGNATTIDALYPRWLLVFVLQAIIFMLMLLWHQGKRFGPIRIAREDTVRFRDERIKALAAWYQKGKKYRDSLNLQADYLKLLLQERWGIPYRVAWVDMAGQLERKWKTVTRDEISTFLAGLEQILYNEQISKQAYLSWSKRIDQLRKEVDEG